MSEIRVTKNKNALKIIPDDSKKGEKKRDFLGSDISIRPCDNCCFVGPTCSGKSLCIDRIVTMCAGPETVIKIFCGNIDLCNTWANTLNRWDERKMTYETYPSLFVTKGGKKVHLLSEFLEKEREKASGGKKHDNKPEVKLNAIEMLAVGQKHEKEAKSDKDDDRELPKIHGKEYPPYIFIFDDLVSELRRGTVFSDWLKQSRHYGVKNIVSSQSWIDLGLGPGARSQYSWVCMMRQLPKKSIKAIRDDMVIPIEEDRFVKLYKKLTQVKDFKKEYPFFFANPLKLDYRKNFTDVLNYHDLIADTE